MKKILLIGTNDIASACAVRLYRAGFSICIISREIPFDLSSFRNFSTALKNGSKTIENIKALSFADFIFHNENSSNLSIDYFVDFTNKDRQIPVLNKNDLKQIDVNEFEFCINCDDALFNDLGSKINMPVISCTRNNRIQADYIIITHGENIGRVKYPFLEYSETEVEDENELYVNSPIEGVFIADKTAGEQVLMNERIGTVDNVEVKTEINGYIKGVLSSGIIIPKDIEVFSISLKEQKGDILELPARAFSIAGGVLESILFHTNLNKE